MAQKSEGFTFETISALAAPSDSGKRQLIEEAIRAHEHDFELAMLDMEYFAQFVQTTDEETEESRFYPSRKFYPKIWETNDAIEEKRRVIIHKGRRAMCSWTGMLRQLWRSMRANCGVPGCPKVFKGGVMTVGENEAQELIGREVTMYESLPDWMKAHNEMHSTTMKVTFARGGESQGFPLTRRGPRTYGFTEVFFDEMAFQEAVRATWRGMIPTLGARGTIVAVSTPNGRFNLFHDVWTNKGDRYGDFTRIWIPHDAHPEHQEEWLRRQTASMSQKDVAREYYGSFSQGEGDPVWDKFDQKLHVWDVEKNGEVDVSLSRPIYIGFDLGFHFPAATVWQRNSQDQWIGILEYQDYDCDFETFCLNLREKVGALYDRRKAFEVFCMPPDAKSPYHQRAKSGARNDVAQVKITFAFGNRLPQVRFCPPEVGTRTNEAPRLKLMRALFKLRADNRFGIVMHPRMEMFIDGCNGGYTYPEGGGEQPEKNEYCCPLDTETLTPGGWKRYNWLRVGDSVYEYDKYRDRLIQGHLLAVNIFDGPRTVIDHKSETMCLSSTPDHRNLIITKAGIIHDVLTKDLKQGQRFLSSRPELQSPKHHPFSDQFIAACAWVAAEGWYRADGSIGIGQSKTDNPMYVDFLKRTLSAFPDVIEHRDRKSNPTMQTWHIRSELAYLIRHWMPNKYPCSQFIAEMSNSDRRRFLYEFWRGDGSCGMKLPDSNKFGRNRDLFIAPDTMRAVQKNEATIDALQMIASLVGIATVKRHIEKVDRYSLTLLKPNKVVGQVEWLERSERTVDGVWCPTTQTGTWICRQNGRVWITGNSHLQDSAQSVFAACPLQLPEPPRNKPYIPVSQRGRIGHGLGM